LILTPTKGFTNFKANYLKGFKKCLNRLIAILSAFFGNFGFFCFFGYYGFFKEKRNVLKREFLF
ncbi:hypothetical protein LNI94_11670, partial [Tenacibaculum finnmarkense genomovar ulcerans]|uniref:hypothetical protein n=1 Tax=Tenacibaculum finnmarkense TaxID=2781243 RepID=UPI001E28A5DB